jgi:PAS domain S-box-containing protein
MKLAHHRLDDRTVSGLQEFAPYIEAAVVIFSLLILAGWTFNILIFKSLILGTETAKPWEAIGFLFGGIALFLSRQKRGEKESWQYTLGLICAILVFLIGGLALLEYELKVDFGIDNLLFHDAVSLETGPFPGRPVFITSIGLVVLGLALLLINSKAPGVDFLVLIVFFTCLIILIGYVYGSEYLFKLAPYRPMPLPSTLLLINLALDYLAARPKSSIMAPITSPLPGGIFARRILLAAILIPFVLGWLWLTGQRRGLYDTELGVALLVGSNVMIFISFIYGNALELNKADLQRESVHASLIQSEERFRSLVEATPAGLMMVEPGGRIALTNTLAENLFGYEPGQLPGKPLDTLLPQQFWIQYPTFRRILNVETRPRSVGTEHDAFGLRKDDSRFPVEIGLSPIETSEGRFTLVSIVDITERKQAEEKIRLLNATLERRVIERTQQLDFERARWQGIVEGIADEVWSCDQQGKMSLLNLGTLTALGLRAFRNKSIEEIYQEVEILYPDGQLRPPEQSPLFHSLRGEIVRGEEIMRHRQTGVKRYRHYSSAPMRDNAGVITGAVAIIRDITEQKQAEEGLRRFELLSANSKDIVLFTHRASGRILEANAAAVKAYGYSRSELLGITIQKLRARNTRILSEDEIGQPGAIGALFESTHLRRDGTIFPVEVSAQGAMIGGVDTVINIVRDITERKQALSKQIYLASIPEQNPNPIAEADFNGQIRYANPIALHTCPDLIEQGPSHPWLAGWSDVIIPFYRNQAEVITRDVATGDRVYQQTLHSLPQERLVRIYSVDVTERKRAEEQLERTNQKLNEILASIQDDFYVLDANWNFVYASKSFTAKMGREPEDFFGNNIWKIFPNYVGTYLEENFRAAMEKREIRRFETGSKFAVAWCRMTVFPSADGITVIGTDVTERKLAEQALQESEERYRAVFENALDAILVTDTGRGERVLSANPAACQMFGYTEEEFLGLEQESILDTSDPYFVALMEQCEQNEQPTMEMTCKRKGGDLFSGELSSAFYQDRDRECRSIAIIRDVTERKHHQAQLSAALQEKEALLKEIHHRVKNNLQVISSLLRLQSAGVADAQIRELFAESQRRVRAMALIHEQLYQSSNLAQINLRTYISDLVNYLRRSYTQILSNVDIRVNIENLVIEMDQAMPLGLLISELVSNSLKYAFPLHGQAGEIWIVARREQPDSLSITVGDNGLGLPENLNIELSPTMGLKLVHSFVTQLQGSYTVQRKSGTIFTITIPERRA